MQGSIAEAIRELMELQQMSVRKVSARIAEQHGGSPSGYTQQISRILNDPSYDPTLSTVQKILSALNVSWQVSKTPPCEAAIAQMSENLTHSQTRLDQLCDEVANLKSGMAEMQQSIAAIATALHREYVR